MNKKGGAGSLPHLQIIVIHPESPGMLVLAGYFVVSHPLIIAFSNDDIVASSNADTLATHCVGDGTLRDYDLLSHPEGQ